MLFTPLGKLACLTQSFHPLVVFPLGIVNDTTRASGRTSAWMDGWTTTTQQNKKVLVSCWHGTTNQNKPRMTMPESKRTGSTGFSFLSAEIFRPNQERSRLKSQFEKWNKQPCVAGSNNERTTAVAGFGITYPRETLKKPTCISRDSII
jgi:hypothetical protein